MEKDNAKKQLSIRRKTIEQANTKHYRKRRGSWSTGASPETFE
jgi:hypothetical protein